MSEYEFTLTTEPLKTARIVQVSSLFDIPAGFPVSTHFKHSLPLEERPWKVGLIVGPSGAGKTQLAKHIFPNMIRERLEWDTGSIVDNFPSTMPISEIVGLLTSVGFGSAPAWLRTYSALSNGEQFRADMARMIAETESLVVVDEFTSVVDRQVAKIASHSVQKAVRKRDTQFVAVTCHYDVEDWLQPDWTYDVAARTFAWRLVQPHPTLQLEIFRSTKTDWSMFSKHHYLTSELLSSAKCYTAYLDGVPVAFTSYIHFMHAKTRNIKMGHRLVVLPDYQGLGIASRLLDWLGQELRNENYRLRYVIAHPGMIHLLENSPRWNDNHNHRKSLATGPQAKNTKANLNPRRLTVRSFEYTPPKIPKTDTSMVEHSAETL